MDEGTKIASLTDGGIFGEVNLIYSIINTATVQAATYCDVLTLARSDLVSVLTSYPEGNSSLMLYVYSDHY